MTYSSPVAASDCENNCVPACEDGWEEERGKCYFFSEDEYTWVGAEEECKRNHGSHLASVRDQQTDNFIGRNINRGEAIWIGARQTFETDEGRWAWADGCSPWSYTSWPNFFNPDGSSEHQCAFFEKNVENTARWRATQCDLPRRQLRFVCSKSICSKDTSITTAVDPITTRPITIVLDQTTIAVGATIAILLILLVASVAILIFKKLKQKQRESTPMKTEGNAVYGMYYDADGERIDQGRAYAQDRNLDYYS